MQLNNYYFNPHALAYFIGGVLIGAEGIFIYLQNKKSQLNFSFFLCLIFASIWQTGVGFIYSSANEQVGLAWSRYYSWMGIIFVTPAVHFFSGAWRWKELGPRIKFVYFNFICAILFYILCFATPHIVLGLWPYSWGRYPRAGSLQIPFMIWFYTLMSLSFRNFIISYKEEILPIRKSQTKLVIIAFIFGFLGSLDFVANFGIPFYTFASISVLIFTTVVAYTIIQYKFMEIETVFHKTFAWLFTSAALIAPLAIVLYFTRDWYVTLSPAGSWSYFAVILLTFLIFVKTCQPRIDHLFQRRQSDLEIISSRFTEDLVHLKGLQQLIQRIEKTIADTLYPQKIDVIVYKDTGETPRENNPFLAWLARNDKIIYRDFIEIDPRYAEVKNEAKDYFEKTSAFVAIPLVLNEKLLGVINLGKKANLRRYTATEFQFLVTLKNQATIAISNSLLYENMEEQVRQRTKELVDVQKQLVQAEKLATVGTLAGGVAHEINNPLTAILTNVQMLLMSDEFDRESLELIEEATKRCRTIVQKLMVYAKKPMESGEAKQVDLRDVIKSVIALLDYQFAQDNIKIIFEARKGEPLVLGNQNELEQVITNVAINSRDAIKQAKKSGEIHISVEKNNDWVKVKIKDDGAGIPKEIITRIFDPFFTTKDVGKGLGLGLSICQSIIEKHQGKITADSVYGKGAEFIVQIPAVKVVAEK